MRAGEIVARGTARELVDQSGQGSLTDAFLHYAGATP